MKHIIGFLGLLLKELALIPLTIYSWIGSTSRKQGFVLFLLAGVIWVPLAQIQAISDPVGAYSRLAMQGIGLSNARTDAQKALQSKIPTDMRKSASRYHVKAWADNLAITSGIDKPSITDRFKGALLSPFRAVVMAVRG